jgi:hypothetical protein
LLQLVEASEYAKVTAKVADFGMSRHVEWKLGDALKTWQWLAPEVMGKNKKQ